MFDLRANTSDTQQVKSYDYNLLQYYSFVYSQGSATKTFCVHFSCSWSSLGIVRDPKWSPTPNDPPIFSHATRTDPIGIMGMEWDDV